MMKKSNIIDNLKTLKKSTSLLWKASKINLLLLFVFNILSGLLIPASLMVWKRVVDSIIDAMTSNTIQFAIFWLCLHGLLQIFTEVINSVCTYLKDMQTDYVNKYITKKVLDKVQKMEMDQFDDSATYNQITKINNEALGRSISINENIISLVKNIVILCGTVGILLSYNWVVVLIILITYFPVFIVNTQISMKLHDVYNSRLEKLRLVEVLKEIYIKYENIKEIKLYRIEDYLKEKVMSIHCQYIDENKKIRKANLKKTNLARGIQYFAAYLTKLYIVIDALKAGNSIGDITMYINSVDILQECTGSLLQIVSTLYNDNLYIETLFGFLERNKDEYKFRGGRIIDTIESIEFKSVYFKYPGCDNYVLKNVDLLIRKNHSYLFVGFNGSGKTTIIKLLTGLYQPTKGEILINGINIKEYDIKIYRKKICAVFQEFLKLPLEVDENIQIGNIDLMKDDERIINSAKKSGAHKFIMNLPQNYRTKLQRGWDGSSELSGGQWQKIALSRAYYSEAEMIVMDEPAASLDAKAEDILYKKIVDMIDHKTCIMISHRLTTAQIVDLIYVVNEGTIAEMGSFEKLIHSGGVFENLYRLQAEKYNIEGVDTYVPKEFSEK